MFARTLCRMAVVILMLATGAPAGAQPKKGFAELQGTWKLMSVEIDGEPMNDRLDEFPRWVIRGNKVRYGGQELAMLTVDPTTTPKSLDLSFRNPARTYEAVYAVEGDTLKICANRMTEGVKERPADFTTAGKPDRRLLIFKRGKAGTGDGIEGAGFIGIEIRISDDKKTVVVSGTFEGSPARKAGLKKGDVIVSAGNAEATDLPTVVRTIRQARAGSEVSVRIRRGDKELDVSLKAGVLPFYLLD